MVDIKDVSAKILQDDALHLRMDADRDMYLLSRYVMKDREGVEVPGIINVTLNFPALFAAHVASALMAATQQAVVSGVDLDPDDAAEIERFLTAFFNAADSRLRKKGEPTLRPFITEQLDIRGRSAARITLRKQDGRLVPDILPVDTRYFVCEHGDDGMEWAAYRTFRTPAMVRSEYPGAKVPEGQGLIQVVDLWDRNTERVYLGDTVALDNMAVFTQEVSGAKEIWQQRNPYGYVPFCYQEVPLGAMLADSEARASRGESIYFLIRGLLPELNRLASVMQTLNVSSVRGPKTWHSEQGTQGEVPEHVDEMAVVTAAPIGGGVQEVPTGDLKAAGKLMHDMLTRLIQAGSLSFTDFGNLTFPLSAVALIELGESSSQVFLPRLGAKGLLYQQMAEMAVAQVLALGLDTVRFGARGNEQEFSTAALRLDYDVAYQYSIKSPQTDVARYSVADVARQWLDNETLLTEVLQVQDPAEIQRRKRLEEAEVLSPGIKLYRIAQALIKEERPIEARIIADELGLTIEQLKTGELEGKKPSDGQQPARNILPPLMGTKAGSNKRAVEAMGQPGGSVEG